MTPSTEALASSGTTKSVHIDILDEFLAFCLKMARSYNEILGFCVEASETKELRGSVLGRSSPQVGEVTRTTSAAGCSGVSMVRTSSVPSSSGALLDQFT
mmetsp:Transcript_62968/g.124435  ORF Transcript_62968/g.124435 Transcript_62968/m.124435 type:complete len:100 (+) Transcript_62968:74-373(+)